MAVELLIVPEHHPLLGLVDVRPVVLPVQEGHGDVQGNCRSLEGPVDDNTVCLCSAETL